MYSYSDLISHFRLIMRDPSALTNKYFTDAEILMYFVDATNELVREVGLSVFTRTLTVDSSTAEYRCPVNSMKIMDVRNSDGEKIYQTTREHLESINTQWPDDSGEVTHYILERDVRNFKFLFYKKPSSSETLTVKAWRIPNHGSDAGTADEPELDTPIVKQTIPYVLAQGFLKKDERTLYDEQMALFQRVSIPNAKKYIRRFDDGILRLASNEHDATLGMGRLPDNYPIRHRY